MSKPILELHGLSVGYREPRQLPVIVSADIDLTIRPGELVCLLGPNGAGKSTLLRTVAGMQAPLAGEVLLEQRDIHKMDARELARILSVVLTERITAGLLTAYELVSFGRYPFTGWAGSLSQHDHAIVTQSIEAVGAQALAQRQVSELSDGERQKVMLARALAQEPRLMILDEITAFLDLPRRVEIMHILRDLAHKHRRTILLSTHDLELALRHADTVWLMTKGAPLCAGAPEDLVLSGSFASAFTSEGIEFNQQLGSFQMRVVHVGQIELLGDGVAAIWTARALERHGFAVLGEGSGCSSRIEILMDGSSPVWRSWHQGRAGQHLSVGAMLQELNPRQDLNG